MAKHNGDRLSEEPDSQLHIDTTRSVVDSDILLATKGSIVHKDQDKVTVK